MKKFHDFIKKHEGYFDGFTMLSDDDIKEAEKKFGFEFDDTLREFFSYSDLDFFYIQPCNIDASLEHLQWLKERQLEQDEAGKTDREFLPSDKFAPINFLDDWFVVYSFGEGRPTGMYYVDVGGSISEVGQTFEEYLIGQWEQALEEEGYDDE